MSIHDDGSHVLLVGNELLACLTAFKDLVSYNEGQGSLASIEKHES